VKLFIAGNVEALEFVAIIKFLRPEPMLIKDIVLIVNSKA
jgi:hypothetical protein